MVSPDRQLIWAGAAEDDLSAIWQYSADEWSPSTADDYLQDIAFTCNLLLEEPELGRARDELLSGARSLPLGSHVIFYRPAPRRIEILRVLHQREDISDIFQSDPES